MHAVSDRDMVKQNRIAKMAETESAQSKGACPRQFPEWTRRGGLRKSNKDTPIIDVPLDEQDSQHEQSAKYHQMSLRTTGGFWVPVTGL